MSRSFACLSIPELIWPGGVCSEQVALEDSASLLPFIHSLSRHKLTTSSIPPNTLSSDSYKHLQWLEDQAKPDWLSHRSPIFNSAMQLNETHALLRFALSRFPAFRSARGKLESVELGLAQRESSVVVEGMRGVWEQAEQEMGQGRDCDSWIDVAGTKCCSPGEFWETVGLNQEMEERVLVLPTR